MLFHIMVLETIVILCDNNGMPTKKERNYKKNPKKIQKNHPNYTNTK